MSWGSVQGMSAAEFERQNQAEIEADRQRIRLIARGRDALRNGIPGGLPAGVVDMARAATATLEQARRNLESKRQQADDEIAKFGYVGGAAEYCKQSTVGPALLALQNAEQTAEKALLELGRVTEQVEKARATKAGLDARRASLKQQCAQAEAQIDADERAADMELARYEVQ